ncbi:hypothetical protein RHGRI_023467 [Rhododendron griersonianum]|uniref:Transposase Tnp1/En/Spm-like domain-containing protein n=1 Tax=Rhododendron griersonianum TaxID=479676 RepID=A0AAV6J943_9ERIC|nr:hypothetical protein RHGRI_023467 [Rhododendron griersonianum]
MPTSSSSTTPSSVTSTTTSQCLVDIRFYLHVFWQGKNVIHALPEAEIINSFIIPYEEEAAAFPLWMVMAPTTRNTGRVHVQPNSSQPHQAAMDDVAVVQPLNEPEIGIEETAGSRKKCNRVRGPTFMCKVWGQQEDERVKVSFNDKGQPISNNSILSHFLGTIARNGKYAPLHYKSWSKMPRVYKDDMFALVLQKFDLCAGHKRWILRSLSKKWRNWKATVKRDNFDSDLPIEEQIHSPPDRVQADQWKELIKYWHGDAKKVSDKNKDSRAGQSTIYRMGKTPLAIVREAEAKNLGHDPSRAHLFLTCFTYNGKEQMKELSKQVPEGELDSFGPNDVFSQAMGKEKSGSVRMYGLGVCPSDVWGEVPSSGTSYRMSMEWKTELDKTNKKLEELTNLYLSRTNGGNTSNIPVTSPNQQIGSSTSFSQRGRVKVGDYVNFKSVANPTDVVGKGRIASMDPSTEVGGEELGANWCEIHVQVPILWDEHLMRPYGGLKTVGDAIGTPIAWPISLVVKDDDSCFMD